MAHSGGVHCCALVSCCIVAVFVACSVLLMHRFSHPKQTVVHTFFTTEISFWMAMKCVTTFEPLDLCTGNSRKLFQKPENPHSR